MNSPCMTLKLLAVFTSCPPQRLPYSLNSASQLQHLLFQFFLWHDRLRYELVCLGHLRLLSYLCVHETDLDPETEKLS